MAQILESGMRLITEEEYKDFLLTHESVEVENVKVWLPKKRKIDSYAPKTFSPEEWTVWSFPERGDWATHSGNYRGNWSPYIPRNLILKYTKVGERVCDPMVGSGTTLVECKLLGRNGIGVDVNLDSAMVAVNRLDFDYKPLDNDHYSPKIDVYQGDARNLDLIESETVDLVATHPPYWGIVTYSKNRIPGDLSTLKFTDYFEAMARVAGECFRVLKQDRYCAILIGDTRRRRHYVPLSIGVLNKFLEAGFVLKEDVIKLQHNMKGSRERWRGHEYDFYKIAHEHLYIFRKPRKEESHSDFKLSSKWW
jgi:DNA modification methylase